MKKLICIFRLHWLFDVPVYRGAFDWRCKRCHQHVPMAEGSVL